MSFSFGKLIIVYIQTWKRSLELQEKYNLYESNYFLEYSWNLFHFISTMFIMVSIGYNVRIYLIIVYSILSKLNPCSLVWYHINGYSMICKMVQLFHFLQHPTFFLVFWFTSLSSCLLRHAIMIDQAFMGSYTMAMWCR